MLLNADPKLAKGAALWDFSRVNSLADPYWWPLLLEKIADCSEEGLVNMESTIPDSIPVSLMQKHKNHWSEF